MEKAQQDKYVSRKEFFNALGGVYTMLLLTLTLSISSQATPFNAFVKIFIMGATALIMFFYILKGSKIHD